MPYQPMTPVSDDDDRPGSFSVPVENVVTAAVLNLHGLLPALNKYRTSVVIISFASVFLQMGVCTCIVVEIIKGNIPIPEECPTFATGAAQNLGLLVLLLYVWSSEFGETIVSIDIISINGLEDNYNTTGLLNALRILNALGTLLCTFWIIRAGDNPVDVIKDCLAIGLIVDIPGLTFTAMQKGLFGRGLYLASKDCDSSEQVSETQGSVCCRHFARLLLNALAIFFWILLILSITCCSRWCTDSNFTSLDSVLKGYVLYGFPSLGPASCTASD